MKIKEKLELLYTYYFTTRGVGHTELLQEGFRNYKNPKFILARDMSSRSFLKVEPTEIVSWNSLDELNKLRGTRKAMAIDNGTMILILTESINRICELEQEVLELREKKSIFYKILKFFKSKQK